MQRKDLQTLGYSTLCSLAGIPTGTAKALRYTVNDLIEVILDPGLNMIY